MTESVAINFEGRYGNAELSKVTVKERPLARELFKMYFAELSTYSNDPWFIEVTSKEITDEYLRKDFVTTYFIRDEKGEVIGFLTISEDFDFIAYGSDYCIMQYYIKPDYRRYGYGLNTIRNYMNAEKSKGKRRVSHLELRKNANARKFWEAVFSPDYAKDETKEYGVYATNIEDVAFLHEVL